MGWGVVFVQVVVDVLVGAGFVCDVDWVGGRVFVGRVGGVGCCVVEVFDGFCRVRVLFGVGGVVVDFCDPLFVDRVVGVVGRVLGVAGWEVVVGGLWWVCFVCLCLGVVGCLVGLLSWWWVFLFFVVCVVCVGWFVLFGG